MKKLRLIAMFALTFALIFGASACKTEAEEGGAWGDSLAEVLKNEDFDPKGTWTATDADSIVETDGDVPDNFFSSSGKEPTKKEKIQMMLDYLNLQEKYEGEDGSRELFYNLLEAETDWNSYYADGLHEYSDYKNKIIVSAMINGSRDVVRLEVVSVDEYKKFTVTQTMYLEYTKK